MGLFDIFKKKSKKEEKPYMSFSNVNENGQFIEALGCWRENTMKDSFDSLTQEEVEQNIRKTQCKKEPCKNNAHDFVLVSNKNHSKYECKLCGISVSEFPKERINMTYLGSYVDGYSCVWKDEDMSWNHIEDFFMVISNYEPWSYKVLVKGLSLVWRKSAPWRPDLPKDFFDEHKIKLTQEQKGELCGALSQLDFSKISVIPSDFDIQVVPNMYGSTYSPKFRCTFQNGRGFECGQCVEELENVERLLLKFIGIKPRDFAIYQKELCDISKLLDE